MSLPEVTLTTDGAARGNPGPGGWAALLEANGKHKLIVGEEPGPTTNNAMELRAVIGGLEALNKPCRVTLRADSMYVLDGLQRILAGKKLPEKNQVLWERLLAAARRHEIVPEWVRGHAGDARNEQVNEEANQAASRAYAQSEAARATDTPADGWTLALCSPTASRPVQWAIIAPTGRRGGRVPVDGVTQPTAIYQALVQALEVGAALPGARAAALTVLSNYELIIKQGRGEWKVKQAEQQPLAARAVQLRSKYADVRFEHTSTERVLDLIEGS